MPNHLRGSMPNFARHEGNWIGDYIHLTATGEVVDTYEVRIFAEFPIGGSCDFRLNTRNVWPDGRESHAHFDMHYRDGRLWFDNHLVGSLWEVDEFTVYLRFGYRDDPSIDVCEMMQISQDGMNRARTWHWFRDQKLFQITLTRERRAD